MTLALVGAAALIAALIQRITGLAFVLVLIGPIVLAYGPIEGVTLAVFLAVIASVIAVPSAWRDVDWRRTLWLLGAGVLAAPFGALVTRLLPEPALLFLIGAMAVLALTASRLSSVSQVLRGRSGAAVSGAVAGFMHAASGLSGPALAAFAVGDRWDQRRFAASAQVIFLGFGIASVLLRGMPVSPPLDVAVLAAATALGIVGGAFLVRVGPPHIARRAMLFFAWAGAIVVLVRASIALFG